MLEAVREGRAFLVDELGLSRRLAARVGALLGQRIACTRAVLEEARDNEALAALLLAKDLRAPGDDLSATIRRLLAEPAHADLAEDLPLAVGREDDWQILALEEELAAEAGFEAVEGADAATKPDAKAGQLPVAQGTLYNRAADGETAAAFSDEAIAELRVAVFAGATSAERVSALRRLAFAPIEAERRIGIFVQALAEEDASLRAAAANGLRKLGLRGDTAEAARLLAEGEPEERRYACERLAVAVRSGDELEVRAGVMALLGALRVEEDLSIRVAAVRTLGTLAPRLEDFAGIADEIMRVVVEQAVAHRKELGGAVREALRAFDAAAPGRAAAYLLAEAGSTADADLRAYLLTAAVACEPPDGKAEALRVAAADGLMALPAESGAAHTLGTYLVREGEAGVALLLDRLPGSDIGHQRFLVHLLDNAVRFRALSDALRVDLARQALALLRSGSRQLLAELFESRLPTPPCLPADLAREMALALLSGVRQFALPQVQENVEHALVRLGVPAVPAMLQMLQDAPDRHEGRVACRAIGRVGLAAERTDAAAVAALREALRVLQTLTYAKDVDAREIFIAMGRICSLGVFDAEIVSLVERNLLNRLQGDASDAPLLEALGWLARSPAAAPELCRRVAGLCRTHLAQETPDAAFSSAIEAGEEVFRVGEDLNVFSELIPACLDALELVVLSPSAPADLRAETVDALLERWRDCVAFHVQWSPANVAQLTAMLGRIGESERLARDARLAIVHTLARRLSDLPVLEALAGVVAAADADEEMDRVAAAVANRLLQQMKEEELTDEDRENYLRALARVASRGAFAVRGGGGPRLLERAVDELALGLRDGIAGALGYLTALRDNERLPANLRERIAEEVRRYTTLTKV